MNEDRKESAKSLYDMTLFDRVTTENIVFIRVPGGWIYENQLLSTCCFIPFSNDDADGDVVDFSSDFDNF